MDTKYNMNMKFHHILLIAYRRLKKDYLLFVPGILSSWIMVEVVARQAQQNLVFLPQIGLFTIFSTGYVSAASISAGRWKRGVYDLTLERASSHALSLIMGILLLFIILSGIMFGRVIISPKNSLFADYFSVSLCSLILAFAALRFWPLYCTTFLYPGYSRWSSSGRGSLWHGPSFRTAWRMTAQPGAFLHISLPLLLCTLVLLGLTFWIRLKFLHNNMIIFFINLILYGGVLSFLSSMCYCCGEQLIVPTRYDQYDSSS